MKKIVSTCPVCQGKFSVASLKCEKCDSRLEGSFDLPPLAKLPDDLARFVLTFVRCRGNIREVEKEEGISYPTVCKKLDMVNQILGQYKPKRLSKEEILEALERGDITAPEASDLLKSKGG